MGRPGPRCRYGADRRSGGGLIAGRSHGGAGGGGSWPSNRDSPPRCMIRAATAPTTASRSAASPPMRWAPSQIGRIAFDLATLQDTPHLLVADDDIARAQQALWQGLRQVVEPAGATALARPAFGRLRSRARRTRRRPPLRREPGRGSVPSVIQPLHADDRIADLRPSAA